MLATTPYKPNLLIAIPSSLLNSLTESPDILVSQSALSAWVFAAYICHRRSAFCIWTGKIRNITGWNFSCLLPPQTAWCRNLLYRLASYYTHVCQKPVRISFLETENLLPYRIQSDDHFFVFNRHWCSRYWSRSLNVIAFDVRGLNFIWTTWSSHTGEHIMSLWTGTLISKFWQDLRGWHGCDCIEYVFAEGFNSISSRFGVGRKF